MTSNGRIACVIMGGNSYVLGSNFSRFDASARMKGKSSLCHGIDKT